MPFDRFRRPPPWYDPERPRYRYFRNRSRAQTRILSWAALVGSVAIVYASSFMPFVNAKDTDPKFELPHHYNMKQIHSKYAVTNKCQSTNNPITNYLTHTNAQILKHKYKQTTRTSSDGRTAASSCHSNTNVTTTATTNAA
eukprot:GHVT01096034.1.p2 GENE.GHVT01096034.1~~GHVT01096034.1.p2  ORF type:complete len:141 (+),score=18.17 GHVT01096034.1:363-785(+)